MTPSEHLSISGMSGIPAQNNQECWVCRVCPSQNALVRRGCRVCPPPVPGYGGYVGYACLRIPSWCDGYVEPQTTRVQRIWPFGHASFARNIPPEERGRLSIRPTVHVVPRNLVNEQAHHELSHYALTCERQACHPQLSGHLTTV